MTDSLRIKEPRSADGGRVWILHGQVTPDREDGKASSPKQIADATAELVGALIDECPEGFRFHRAKVRADHFDRGNRLHGEVVAYRLPEAPERP